MSENILLKLFLWSNIEINGQECAIYSLAENEQRASELALDTITDNDVKQLVAEQMQQKGCTIHNSEVAFIINPSGSTLIA